MRKIQIQLQEGEVWLCPHELHKVPYDQDSGLLQLLSHSPHLDECRKPQEATELAARGRGAYWT